MAVDVRATVICNLGPLITASISDDYIQGTGLIRTSGSCQIAVAVYPEVGSDVTFQYTKNGITRTIPRALKVLSSFADPFRNITTVELGCQLTFMQDVTEPIDWTAYDDPDNTEADLSNQSIVTLPISAKSIANKCMQEIGITGDIPLTSKFSVEKFDLSSGYVNILSDLLVSESYCGYMGTDGELKVFSLEEPSGTVRVVTEDELIDVGPIGVGQLPGDAVIVSYNTLKLLDPEEDESEENIRKRNWEYEKVEGARSGVYLQGTYRRRPGTFSPGGDDWDNVFYYVPLSETSTSYDSWDRVRRRETVETSIRAAVNSAYITEAINITQNQTIALQKVKKRSVTEIRYKKQAPPLSSGQFISKITPEEGYDEVLSETTTEYATVEEAVGGAAGNYYDEATRRFYGLPTNEIVTAVTEVTYETSARDVIVVNEGNENRRIGYFPITKTRTKRKILFPQTARGQQYLAKKTEEGAILPEILGPLLWLVDGGTEVRTVSGREAVFQGRPSSADRNAAALADGGDQNNGYRTESSSQIEFVTGDREGRRRVEFSMPYAPDDTFVKIGEGQNATFRAITSDAKAKANLFGRTQNALLLGNRNGINIQTSPEVIPSVPYSPIAIQARSLTAIYATNGTSWTMDSNGIIVSTDALLIGASSKA